MARTLSTLWRENPRPASLEVVGDTRPPVTLLDIKIDPLPMAAAVDAVEAFVAEVRPRQVATVNLDFLRLARGHRDFAATLNGADLALADGMPLVWASRVAGTPLPERVAGVDLVASICQRGAAARWRFFLLGAAPGVAERAGDGMTRRWPGLEIAGTYSPPIGAWDDLEEQRIRDRIRHSNAHVLLVALGAPRQDNWIAANKDRIGVPVSIGVGCTLDVLAGETSRAPEWMQSKGLEWFFRLISEPRRLWHRYLLHDLPVFARLMLGAAARRFQSRESTPGGQA